MPTRQDDQLPDGSWVEWQGQVFRGATDPDDPASVLVFAATQLGDLFTRTLGGGWARSVTATEVRRFSLQTYGRWRGERFQVVDRSPEGLLGLIWTGRDQSRAEELGLGRMDQYTWGTTAPETEVTDLEQVRLEDQPEGTSEDALETVLTWLGGRSTPAEMA